MAKFYGEIGYAETIEKSPGVWVEEITERMYYGDIRKEFVRQKPAENLNDNIEIDDKCEIMADPFAYENFHNIRYIHWMGAKWKVKSIEVSRPRLILWIGGVYNEQTI